ncbi:MAG TPA: hypothetical protein VFP00_05545 [Burkholderiales bacterium]|nr:hypothetical protein [Burkholderiales bacterium]
MRHRACTWAVMAALLFGWNAAHAASEEVKSLQDALSVLNQEQQAIYQQFQMIQQLRRSNAEPVAPAIGGGAPGNYDEMIATKRAQSEREEAYARELRDLYQRHRDIEREKQPIIENLRRLREKAPPAR